MAAVVLKMQIISAVMGDIDGFSIDTWTYMKSGDKFDIIFHNPAQYVDDPTKNVIFKVEVEGKEVSFSTAWWKGKTEPTREMLCLHTGRLTEMLLRYFSGRFMKYNITEF